MVIKETWVPARPFLNPELSENSELLPENVKSVYISETESDHEDDSNLQSHILNQISLKVTTNLDRGTGSSFHSGPKLKRMLTRINKILGYLFFKMNQSPIFEKILKEKTH